MTTIKYITVREFSEYHQVDLETVHRFINEGLITTHHRDDTPCIEEQDIEALEIMIRLHDELGINVAGVETIMYMRRRMTQMQNQLTDMEYRLSKYEQLLQRLF